MTKTPLIIDHKSYVEIGPNLRAVLEIMLNKITGEATNPVYYQIAFGPICQLIQQLSHKEHCNETNKPNQSPKS